MTKPIALAPTPNRMRRARPLRADGLSLGTVVSVDIPIPPYRCITNQSKQRDRRLPIPASGLLD